MVRDETGGLGRCQKMETALEVHVNILVFILEVMGHHDVIHVVG